MFLLLQAMLQKDYIKEHCLPNFPQPQSSFKEISCALQNVNHKWTREEKRFQPQLTNLVVSWI